MKTQILRCALVGWFALVASPLLAGDVLKGEHIRDLFTGNTVSGHYVDGKPFSEYHAADGRALGDNGHSVNIDACWNIEGDHVCYHYGQPKDRRSYCFIVERIEKDLHLRVANTGRLNAIATIEQGNTQTLGDGGRRWSCDDLLATGRETISGLNRSAQVQVRPSRIR